MIDAFLRFTRRFERRVSPLVLGIFAVCLLVGGVVGFVQDSSEEPSISSVSAPRSSTTVVARAIPTGFRTVSYSITPQGGSPKTFCGLLADTDSTRSQGLMNQHNVAGFDGMIFSFPVDVSSAFYMANVPEPLAIAWFSGTGSYVSAAEMTVCQVAAAQCPRYSAAGSYRYALEVRGGTLTQAGIGTGSTLTVGAPSSCV